MIPYDSINLGLVNIKVWGLLVSLGVIFSIFLIIKEANKKKLDLKKVYDLLFWVLVGIILGGRLFYVLFNKVNLIDALKIWEGGMSFFGGFVFAILFGYIYLKKKKLSIWKYIDIIILYSALGYAIGRIGCFLVQDHIGKISSLPWAIFYNSALRHPIALYHVLLGLGLFFILYKLKDKYFDGFLTIAFVLTYGIVRFFLDFLRIEPLYYGLTDGQYISIIFIIISVIILIKRFKSNKRFIKI